MSTHIKPHRTAAWCPWGLSNVESKGCQLKLLLIAIMNSIARMFQGGGVERYKGVVTIVQLRFAANWIALKMLQQERRNVAQQQIQVVLSQASSRVGKRGREKGSKGGVLKEVLRIVCGRCTFASRNAYNKFHTFL